MRLLDSFCPAFEAPAPIYLYGVKSMGVHFRRVEHDVADSAVPEKVSAMKRYIKRFS
jgi:hypothetical protein